MTKEETQSKNKARTSWIFWVFPVVTLLSLLFVAYWGWNFFYEPWRALKARQYDLMYKSNISEIDASLYQLWQKHHAKADVELSPNDPSLPDIIKNMAPHYILIAPNGTQIELGGAEWHFGFETLLPAEPVDPDRLLMKNSNPSKKLASDLWYYSELGLPKQP